MSVRNNSTRQTHAQCMLDLAQQAEAVITVVVVAE